MFNNSLSECVIVNKKFCANWYYNLWVMVEVASSTVITLILVAVIIVICASAPFTLTQLCNNKYCY